MFLPFRVSNLTGYTRETEINREIPQVPHHQLEEEF